MWPAYSHARGALQHHGAAITCREPSTKVSVAISCAATATNENKSSDRSTDSSQPIS